MPAIQPSDLSNAKVDVDHIADVATSTAPTATDRKGGVKRTLVGVIAYIQGLGEAAVAAFNAAAAALMAGLSAAAAITETAQNRAATETAAASAATNAQVALIAGHGYASIAAANSDGTLSVGSSFAAPLADGSFQAYLKTATSGSAADPIGQPFASGAKLAAISGANPTVVPQIFESLDPSLQGVAILLANDRRIVQRMRDPRVDTLEATAATGGFFETLDPSYSFLFLDAAKKILGAVANLAPVTTVLAAAAGSQTSVAARLSNGLTPYGDPLGPFANRWALRETRMRLERLKIGEATQLVHALISDSFGDGDYWVPAYVKQMQDEFGMAGLGFIGFAWWGTAGGTWTTGAQPPGIPGSIRPDLVPTPMAIGAWTSSYNLASNNTPALYKSRSTTPGDYWTFSLPVAGPSATFTGSTAGNVLTPTAITGSLAVGQQIVAAGVPGGTTITGRGLVPGTFMLSASSAVAGVAMTAGFSNSCRLFYNGDGTGVVQVSWDDGATYSANIALATVGAANVALAGVPTTACVARIKVVSGNVDLAGVDHQNTAPGFRFHRLCGSGSTTTPWASVNGALWSAQVSALGAHLFEVMHATNPQIAGMAPSQFATDLATIFNNIKLVHPYCDRLVAVPAENQIVVKTYEMPLYARAAREFALPADCGFIDHQYLFGSPANNAAAYANSNAARPWYHADLTHPAKFTGGRVIAAGHHQFITRL